MNTVSSSKLSPMRVLLVEDDASLRSAVRLILEMEGAAVVEASTGSEAVGLASTQAFDVVLTDLGLADLSGEAVVSAIRLACRAPVPILVLSGAAETDLARALRVGAQRVFRKPFDGDELVACLARYAPRARERDHGTARQALRHALT